MIVADMIVVGVERCACSSKCGVRTARRKKEAVGVNDDVDG